MFRLDIPRQASAMVGMKFPSTSAIIQFSARNSEANHN